MIIVVATILVAVLLSVLVVVSIKKRKNEQRQSAIILEQEKKLRMLEQKEHEWEKKRMESEIGKKSRELTTFSIDLFVDRQSAQEHLRGAGRAEQGHSRGRHAQARQRHFA